MSKHRFESNKWLKVQCKNIIGKILSIGSADDSDGQGGFYRSYFNSCTQYVTSEVDNRNNVNMPNLDVCNMYNIENETFDAVFCSGVLEHIIDFNKAIKEMHRITKPQGILLLGLPFNQPIHMSPMDYWRFTKFGIHEILRDYYTIESLVEIGNAQVGFPVAYWTKCSKVNITKQG